MSYGRTPNRGHGRLARTIPDGEPTTEYTYDTLGDRISTCRSADGPSASWRRSTTHTSFFLLGGAVWQVATNTFSCSDASIAPLVTISAQQLTGLTTALPIRSRTTDVRGNVSETTLAVSAPTATTTMAVPYATNAQRSLSRYGIELQTISVSCVTNTYAYDALGRQVSVTDGRGNVACTEYDTAGRQSATLDALGNRTAYAYDAFGHLASVTDPLGNATVYEYDLRGNKTYEGGATYPVRYTYDVFGNLTTLSTTRDLAADQLTDPSSVSWDTTTWLYDEASGALTNKVYSDGMGPVYDYTPSGRLSRRTWARGILTEYAYDSWGNLTNTFYSDETPTISLAYDAMGRMASAVVEGVSTNLYFHSAYGELTNEVQNGISIARNYDTFSRPTGYLLRDSATPREVNYSYDAAGRRVSRIDTFDGATTTNAFGYNVRSEVTSAAMGTNNYGYAYDPIGNREWTTLNGVTNTYAANPLNQYTLIDGTSPSYDANGNMTADGSGWHYFWNGENRMVCASNAEVVVTYAYDHRGRMVRKNISHGDAETQSIAYLWDDWSIIRVDFLGLVDTSEWGVTDFIVHYFGRGEAIDLSNWKGLRDFINAIRPLTLSNVEFEVKKQCIDAKFQCEKEGDTSFRLSGEYASSFMVRHFAKAWYEAFWDVNKVLNRGNACESVTKNTRRQMFFGEFPTTLLLLGTKFLVLVQSRC